MLDQSVYGASGLIELKDGGFLVVGFFQLVNGRSYDAIILRTASIGSDESGASSELSP